MDKPFTPLTGLSIVLPIFGNVYTVQPITGLVSLPISEWPDHFWPNIAVVQSF